MSYNLAIQATRHQYPVERKPRLRGLTDDRIAVELMDGLGDTFPFCKRPKCFLCPDAGRFVS